MRFFLIGVSLFFAAVIGTPCHAFKTEFAIHPGVGIGNLRLGATKGQMVVVFGKPDGEYSLPGGIHAQYSLWKEAGCVSTMRVFFDAGGRAVQIKCEESGDVGNSETQLSTADRISLRSSLADVAAKYSPLKRSRYRAKDGRIDYYDNTARGIAFEFTRAETDGESKKRLYAIAVHRPGSSIIVESDERPTRAK